MRYALERVLGRVVGDCGCSARGAVLSGVGTVVEFSNRVYPFSHVAASVSFLFSSQRSQYSSTGFEPSTSDGATSGESAEGPSGKPVGPGYGFDKRFKDMTDTELKFLLENAPRLPKEQKRIHLHPSPIVHEGHNKQYTLTDQVIVHAYRPLEHAQDAFAVVEAGHSQFKGKRIQVDYRVKFRLLWGLFALCYVFVRTRLIIASVKEGEKYSTVHGVRSKGG